MEKNLRLNEDKCVVITIGTKKQREETKIQLKTNPIMCGKFEMKQAEKEKWLGQQISAGGLAESVAETVAAKEGKIKAACIEVANIVNSWRTEIVGGLDADGAIKRKNEEWLRKEAEGKRKCEKIMRETFGKKNYITKNKVGEVRNMFKARVGKLPDRKMLKFKIKPHCGEVGY